VSRATCDFRFTLQDEYAAAGLVDDLAELGVSNQAVTILRSRGDERERDRQAGLHRCGH
jgi:hypothetical protein